MVGRLAVPDGEGRRPGILIAHEGNGLDEHQKERAAHLAGLGYVAFALDYVGGGKPLQGRDETMALLGPLMGDADRIRALGRAGLDILLSEPRTDSSRVVGIGYCFGGTVVLELARAGADLAAVVGFHSGLATSRPEDARNIKGRVLVCIGAEDPIIPPEQRTAFEQEMRAGEVAWQMNLYGGAVHSFTHPNAEQSGLPGLRYDERADKSSWKSMLDLFDDVFA